MSAPDELKRKVFDYCVADGNYCSYPVKLDNITPAMFKDGWLYAREHGFFRVWLAGHVFLQSFIYGLSIYDELYEQWEASDHKSFLRFFRNTCQENHESWQEKFLDLPGTAFLSNVSYKGYAVVSRMRNLTRTEHLTLGFECDIITLEEYDNLPYERAEEAAPPKKKRKAKPKATETETYEYKKGEILDFDDIAPINALGGNDWWDPQEEGSDMIKITRDVKIEIKIWK